MDRAEGSGPRAAGPWHLPELTVEENLEAGAYVRNDRDAVRDDIEHWLGVFPRLAERRTPAAGSLSGGEQQMLAVARALMLRPKLFLLDEPSLGLAPMLTKELFKQFADLNREFGTTMFIVEQNAGLALSIAARGIRPRGGPHRAVRLERRAARP